MRYARAAIFLPLIALVVLLLGYGVAHQHGSRGLDRALAEGRRPAAPALRLPRLGAPGDAQAADWRGRVVVVNFWASWCEPCRAESPLLERWQRKLAGQGATVVGVDTEDVAADALGFARRLHLSYPLLRDRDGAAARRFGVTGYPETVVLDRRGRVAAVKRGPVDDAFMVEQVTPLLGEAT
jgi:cytochrome c biogenesis protein CcmG, thiol:disulfide interchange protein DsbE